MNEVVLEPDVYRKIDEIAASWRSSRDTVVNVILRKELLNGEHGISDEDLLGKDCE